MAVTHCSIEQELLKLQSWTIAYSSGLMEMVRMRLYHFIDLILKRSITSNNSFLFLEVSIQLLQLELLHHHAPCVLSLNTLTNHFIIVLKHHFIGLKNRTLPTILCINVREKCWPRAKKYCSLKIWQPWTSLKVPNGAILSKAIFSKLCGHEQSR